MSRSSSPALTPTINISGFYARVKSWRMTRFYFTKRGEKGKGGFMMVVCDFYTFLWWWGERRFRERKGGQC